MLEKRLEAQGNQASKLLSEVYRNLKQSGVISKQVYLMSLDDNDTVLLDAGVDITKAASGLTIEHDAIVITTNTGATYSLTKTAVFGNSAIFNAVMSLDTALLMLVGYVTNGSINIQTCSLPISTKLAIHLDIGNLQEVKDNNIAALKNTQGHFFVNIDYGYGVGTYQTGLGGFAHVTTAYGNEVFYKINADGSVVNDNDYIKPNEPYTVHLDASQIDTTLDDITAAKVQEAGELIVSGSSGLITYTRAADSTETTIYFTDNRKDGKLAVLTYTASTKIITASIV